MPTRRALALLLVLAGCGLRLGGRDPGEPTSGERGQPCETVADCPKPKAPCFAAACADGACRDEAVVAGTIPEQQEAGDCKQLVCDGRGRAIHRADPGDTPADDGNACTEERCVGDQPERAPLSAGAACGQGGVCNGAGVCGVCVPDARRCTTGGTPEHCDPSGQWEKGRACGGDHPVCSRGGCGRVLDLALGEGVTCARLGDGARCFGSDRDGLLSPSSKVTVIEGGAEEIALGLHHGCARLGGGAVTCWGDNAFGELGDGTRAPRAGLVRVLGVTSAQQIAAGAAHTCARLADGAVTCWGLDHHGQLGDGAASGDRKLRLVPEPGGRAAALDLEGAFAELALGGDRACARLPSGAVECWGSGARAPVATPTPPVATPTPPVATPPDPRSPAAPHPPSKGPSRAPAPAPPHPPPHAAPPRAPPPHVAPALRRVAGLRDVVEIAAGAAHTCARLRDGAVTCWGAGEAGQLGDGGSSDRRAPARVAGLAKVEALALGRAHTCALLHDATVTCWGDNAGGQLGDGTTTTKKRPTLVRDLAGVAGIAARGDHTCAWLRDGSVRCWGDNVAGDLGDGSAAPRSLPVTVQW